MTENASDHLASEYLPDFETAGRVLRELTQDAGDAPGDADPAFPALDGYMLERVLGSGASGAVYLGRRVGGDTRVAVKVFHQRLGSGAGSRRVWRELDLLAQTRVPCLPRLIDSFEHEGRPCLVTEFIDGHPLGDACEAMRLSDRERVALLADVCRATHQLHERGIIHRDLKPSNVLVTESRDVFIIDLGIARLLEHDAFATLTHEGSPIGSPAFMSPEQASGGDVSTRSDVYALGAIGYVLLTGETPHDMTGTLHASIKAVSEDEAREPTALAPRLDRSLAAVLRRAVSRAPEARYASASDLADDLERWLRREPVTARRPGVWQRGARWVGRHPVLTTLIACIVLLVSSVALTAGSVWWINSRPAKVEWFGTKSPVRLLTLSGRELRRWPSFGDSAETIPFGGELARPSGSDLVVVAHNVYSDSRYAGLLTAFAMDDWSGEPLWVRGVTNEDIALPEHITGNPPADSENAPTGTFRVTKVQIADVYPAPEHPGQEIITLHHLTPWSATCIRVYDHAGEILHESWHDGSLFGVHYNEQAGALVLGGVNSESRYDQLSSCRDDPIVLFAIDLTPGRTDKLLTDKDCPDAFRPLWYRFLTPHDSTCEFTLKRCAPNTAIRSRAPLFEVSFEPHDQLRGSTYAFYLSMNFDGNIVGRTIDTAVSSSIGIDIDAIGFVDAGILIKR